MLSSQLITQETQKITKIENSPRLSFFISPTGNFNRQNYEKNLRNGHLKTYSDLNKKCIVIAQLFSNERGCGFGAAAIRSQVQQSIAEKFDGNIQLKASWSSHLFYLYMGLIPIDRPVSYIGLKYDYKARALKDLAKCTNETDLLKLTDRVIEYLKDIMHCEFKIPKEIDISLQDILNHRDDLIALEQKKAYYIKDVFIPWLLNVLKNNHGEKYPDTLESGPLWMMFAPEGKKRWLEAISKNNEFEPFRDLSHLKSYLADKDEIAHFEKVVDEYRKSLVNVKYSRVSD